MRVIRSNRIQASLKKAASPAQRAEEYLASGRLTKTDTKWLERYVGYIDGDGI